MMVTKPFSTSPALLTPTITPPASVLCKISGETILSTTGKPMPTAILAASAGEVATTSLGTAIPYASQTSLPSGAVNDVRPSDFTLSKICRTTVWLLAILRAFMLAVAVGASIFALSITCSTAVSLLAICIPFMFSVDMLSPYHSYRLNRCAHGARCFAHRVGYRFAHRVGYRFATRCDGLCEQFRECV